MFKYISNSAHENFDLIVKRAKPDLVQIIHDIKNPAVSNDSIIDAINLVQLLSKRLRNELKKASFEYTLLEASVQAERYRVFKHLITQFNFGSGSSSKSQFSPLYLIIKQTAHQSSNHAEILTDLFDFIMEKSDCINDRDENSQTPLHYTVTYNHYIAAQLLLKKPGLLLNVKDNKSMTPLQMACRNVYTNLAKLFIENTNPSELLSQLSGPNGVLISICKHKTEEFKLFKLIVDKLRDSHKSGYKKSFLKSILKQEDANGASILHVAIVNNHVNIVEYLLSHFIIDLTDRNANSPIHLVAQTGSIEMLNLLKKYNRVDCLKNNVNTPFHVAAYYNNYEFIELLATNNKDLKVQSLNKDGNTPLFVAVKAKSYKCVETLFKLSGGSTSFIGLNGDSVYHVCAEFGNNKSFKFFLKQIPDLNSTLLTSQNSKEETILHISCRVDNLEAIKLTLLAFARDQINLEKFLHVKNSNGQTCFHVACSHGFFSIVSYFIEEYKALDFVHLLDSNANTALHVAASSGHSSIASLLLLHMRSLDARNDENYTALELSCREGYYDISKKLINRYLVEGDDREMGIDWALHVACNEGADEIVKLLLEKGVPIDVLNKEKKNCLDIAISKRHHGVIKILLEDRNWSDLIRNNNSMPENANILTSISWDQFNSNHSDNFKFIENPQLRGLFEAEMWDIIELILDRCLTRSNNKMGFGVLDRQVKSMYSHPLMLIARSGQQKLVKHEATTRLLDLKWRFLPRLIFIMHLLLSFLFLVIIAIYSSYIITSKCNLTTTRTSTPKPLKACSKFTLNCGSSSQNPFSVQSVNCSKGISIDQTNTSITCMNALVVYNYENNYRSTCDTLSITCMSEKCRLSDESKCFNLITQGCNELEFTCSTLSFSSAMRAIDLIDCPKPEFKCTEFKSVNITDDALNDGDCLIRDDQLELVDVLLVVAFFNLAQLFVQFLFLNRRLFLFSVQTYMELFTYGSAIASVYSPNFETQKLLATVTVLSAFLVFPLYLQKVKIFGVYVLALKKTVSNSLKFMPLLFLLLTGFILAFNMRVDAGVKYFEIITEGENATETIQALYSVVRAVTLVLGDFDTNEMGIESNNFVNYSIYFVFIGLMCVVMLNLLVGIAVSDINLVLDEADIRQIILRIFFVLQVQSVIESITKRFSFVNCIVDMRFEEFKPEDKVLNWIKSRISLFVSSGGQSIDLDDPQKRLENKLDQIIKANNQDVKSIERLFRRELDLIESEFLNANQRLEDNLLELGQNTSYEFKQCDKRHKELCDSLSHEVTYLKSAMYVNESRIVREIKEHFDQAYQNIRNELVLIRTATECDE